MLSPKEFLCDACLAIWEAGATDVFVAMCPRCEPKMGAWLKAEYDDYPGILGEDKWT
jgi:hypothetical protein